MIGHAMLLGLLLVGMDGPRAASPETAADRVTLRDGSIVMGLVTSTTTGPRGSVEFLVRRAWAEKSLGKHLQSWDRSTAATTRLAIGQRRKRLEAWRRERASSVGPDDRIMQWIDWELARSAAPGKPEPSILLSVRLPRNEVRGMERRPAQAERLLRLAWLCDLPDPESMPLAELKDALEARGYAVDAVGKKQPAVLDRLLPPTPEPEPTWLARRAATELAVDPDLRFIRFQDTVIPDAGAGQPLAGVGLSTALSELKRLLDPDQAQQADPLAEKLKAIAARGRIGAIVTRLEIAPDLTDVTVDSTLWIRSGERWAPFGSRNATVRPDDLGREAGKNLEADPQVQGAFRIAELLGLGAIPPETKQRSLRIGAATEKALGMARSAFNQDLDALALPVLEPRGDDRPPVRNPDQRVPR
ncbi:MAG: hypothetical protein ACHRXM_24085 [Isosphaerales bacterium]